MEVSTTFMPTAGVVGLLSMVTYFFLVVAMFAFISNFIFALTTHQTIRPDLRISYIITAIIAAIGGITYYLTQYYYYDMLRELAIITDASDRQTLIRESYNAIGQYRYMGWFLTAPLLLVQLILGFNLPLRENKRSLTFLLVAASGMFFASFIGHHQLSFDNEIQVGPKVSWGIVATVAYGFIVFTLFRSQKQRNEQITYNYQTPYTLAARLITTCWGIYLFGYFLTMADVDFNWIYIGFTIADLISQIGVGMMVYFASLKPLEK